MVFPFSIGSYQKFPQRPTMDFHDYLRELTGELWRKILLLRRIDRKIVFIYKISLKLKSIEETLMKLIEAFSYFLLSWLISWTACSSSTLFLTICTIYTLVPFDALRSMFLWKSGKMILDHARNENVTCIHLCNGTFTAVGGIILT